MAESAEDKDAVTRLLDQDREQLAIEAGRLRRRCDVPGKLTASIQQDPVPWVIGATVTGFLLSLLPARRKKIYLARDSDRLRPTKAVHACLRPTSGRPEALETRETADQHLRRSADLQAPEPVDQERSQRKVAIALIQGACVCASNYQIGRDFQSQVSSADLAFRDTSY